MHMRRCVGRVASACAAAAAARRSVATLPWATQLPPPSDARWRGVGAAVVELARSCDTGAAAFAECYAAREQLEAIVQSIGFDMTVYIFGGLVTMGFLEVGGDVDFVCVADVEPGVEEAGEVVSRIARELRRYGLRAWAVPRARVPVIKADRVSRDVPGAPLRSVATDGTFQFARALTAHEASEFDARLRGDYDARGVEWDALHQTATAHFASTTALMAALTQVKRHASSSRSTSSGGGAVVDVLLRVPSDVRHGPEVYRFPFDLCVSSTGLRNSYLLGDVFARCPYARHLLLVLKKWGRASGVVNSIDGLLASYALTVMLAHLLVRTGAVPRVQAPQLTDAPQPLAINPPYRALATADECALDECGYALAAFLEYYSGHGFDYAQQVVCCSNTQLSKRSMRWDDSAATAATTAVQTTPLAQAAAPPLRRRPPYFGFCIKDPYGLDNIARNLDDEAVAYVRQAHNDALAALLADLHEPAYVVNTLVRAPPRPPRQVRSLSERGIQSERLSPDQLEARHVLHKLEFHERKRAMERFGRSAAQHSENQGVAAHVTHSVLGWIRSDVHE